ncbi:class III lanthipeptide [Amycolatopsis samaneae]|uniref:Class III lanthipeptide n=1 Tax=Amycolatopsis samaneae TaxID=664691 RepID=A0ABW5GXY3_9PSEU
MKHVLDLQELPEELADFGVDEAPHHSHHSWGCTHSALSLLLCVADGD